MGLVKLSSIGYLIVPKLAHNEPFYRPQLAYWGLILSRSVPEGASRLPLG
jgi:hypothetical protein